MLARLDVDPEHPALWCPLVELPEQDRRLVAHRALERDDDAVRRQVLLGRNGRIVRRQAIVRLHEAAALRLGFRYDGLFPQATIYKGRNRDTAWYSILDGEWPEVRDIFQTWLDPANFDADGKPKTSLSAAMAGRSSGRLA